MAIYALLDGNIECRVVEFGDVDVTVSINNVMENYPYKRIIIPNLMVVMSTYLDNPFMLENFKKYLKLKHG